MFKIGDRVKVYGHYGMIVEAPERVAGVWYVRIRWDSTGGLEEVAIKYVHRVGLRMPVRRKLV